MPDSEEVTIKKEKLNELIQNQLKDKKTEFNTLNGENLALSSFAMVKNVEQQFIEGEIKSVSTQIKTNKERMETLLKEIKQLEGQFKK